MVEIKVVDPTKKREFKPWVDFVNKLYEDCPHYIPYLFGDEMNLANPKKNVAFDECEARYFLAYKDGKIVGRVAGIIQHTSNEKENKKNMRLSRLDFVNDVEVVRALTQAVEDYAREKGMDTVHGPYGFNDMDREGFRTKGFDRDATFATNYNYDYYLPLLLQCGYEIENVAVNGIAVGAVSSYVMSDIKDSSTIQAFFKQTGATGDTYISDDGSGCNATHASAALVPCVAALAVAAASTKKKDR